MPAKHNAQKTKLRAAARGKKVKLQMRVLHSVHPNNVAKTIKVEMKLRSPLPAVVHTC